MAADDELGVVRLATGEELGVVRLATDEGAGVERLELGEGVEGLFAGELAGGFTEGTVGRIPVGNPDGVTGVWGGYTGMYTRSKTR